MRRKIARRIKKQLRGLGCEIRDPHFIKESGLERKQCGFAAEIIFKNICICSIGHDELVCYRMALEDVLEEIREPFLTKDYDGRSWDEIYGKD